ncbi:MAG: TetR/AcrR family transcriptional regulator [Thermodesulfobacteriota bacterium]|nr:TetR/AcrR family transcriptional regulator [Thermodesulfobacteriota bacterium]
MENVREKILDVSRELFLAQGYKKTTTRQILARAGIKNGTLYHFFRSKDHILLHLAANLFDEASAIVEALAGKDPVLQYTIAMNLEFYAIEKHERLAEMFYEAYRSWTVLEFLVQKGAQRNRLLFEALNPGFTDQDYYVRTMAIKSSIYGFIADRYHKGSISYQDKTSAILELTLSLFNVPAQDLKKAIKKADDILEKETIVISGFSI